MIGAILRTGLYAIAGYGAYTIARRFYPSQVDGLVDSATSKVKDISGDVSKQFNDTAKNLSSSANHQIKKAV